MSRSALRLQADGTDARGADCGMGGVRAALDRSWADGPGLGKVMRRASAVAEPGGCWDPGAGGVDLGIPIAMEGFSAPSNRPAGG